MADRGGSSAVTGYDFGICRPKTTQSTNNVAASETRFTGTITAA